MKNIQNLVLDDFDFLDFGCSKGASIKFAKKFLGGGRELGIDIDEKKVQKSINEGYEAVLADVTKLNLAKGKVRFVMMSHFLEHIPSHELARNCIETAVEVASQFVFIRQPWFDSDGLLFQKGFKFYWSDWQGHPNRMTSLEFDCILRPLLKGGKIKRYLIYGAHSQVTSSESELIHPLDSRPNSHEWNPQVHSAKPLVKFDFEVYREIKVLIVTGDDVDIVPIEKALPVCKLIYDSGSI